MITNTAEALWLLTTRLCTITVVASCCSLNSINFSGLIKQASGQQVISHKMGFEEGCFLADEPMLKRARKAVQRYGFETKTSVEPLKSFTKSEDSRTARISRAARRSRRKVKSKASRSRRKTRTNSVVGKIEEKLEEEIEDSTLELTDLSEEVLLLILERVPAFGLINLSKTSSQFNRLCLMDTIWKQRCKVS